MKTLIDGIEVSSRSYYYLLDFNESNDWEFIRKEFNKHKLYQLTIQEYKKLFEHATYHDLKVLELKIELINH